MKGHEYPVQRKAGLVREGYEHARVALRGANGLRTLLSLLQPKPFTTQSRLDQMVELYTHAIRALRGLAEDKHIHHTLAQLQARHLEQTVPAILLCCSVPCCSLCLPARRRLPVSEMWRCHLSVHGADLHKAVFASAYCLMKYTLPILYDLLLIQALEAQSFKTSTSLTTYLLQVLYTLQIKLILPLPPKLCNESSLYLDCRWIRSWLIYCTKWLAQL